MVVDYVRRDIPEEISEDGGAYIQLVNKKTVGLDASIKEARDGLFVVAEETFIKGCFDGVMRSVFEGIAADGHPRTVGDITFYPVCNGVFDLDTGWNPLVNSVTIKARLINGVTLDITDWSFNDVTPGRQNFSITSVSDGTTEGVVSSDMPANINGKDFPAQDKLTVLWSCNGKSGTVASEKFTANVTRVTVDNSAFATLTSADNGKEIEFTIKGCYVKKTKKGLFTYVAPAVPSVTLVKCGDQADNVIKFEGGAVTVTLTDYTPQDGDKLYLEAIKDGAVFENFEVTDQKTASAENLITFANGIENTSEKSNAEWVQYGKTFYLLRGSTRYDKTISFVA